MFWFHFGAKCESRGLKFIFFLCVVLAFLNFSHLWRLLFNWPLSNSFCFCSQHENALCLFKVISSIRGRWGESVLGRNCGFWSHTLIRLSPPSSCYPGVKKMLLETCLGGYWDGSLLLTFWLCSSHPAPFILKLAPPCLLPLEHTTPLISHSAAAVIVIIIITTAKLTLYICMALFWGFCNYWLI